MPSELQMGKAVLFGIQSDGKATGTTPPLEVSGTTEAEGYASFIWDTAKLQHKFKIHDIEDESEFDVSAVATNEHFELDVKWTPAGTTRADLAGKAVFLTPLSKVTLKGFRVTAFNGDYQYRGDQAIDLAKAVGTMMLKLRRYANADQNASLVTTVQG